MQAWQEGAAPWRRPDHTRPTLAHANVGTLTIGLLGCTCHRNHGSERVPRVLPHEVSETLRLDLHPTPHQPRPRNMAHIASRAALVLYFAPSLGAFLSKGGLMGA